MSEVVYSTQRSGFEPGRTYRNPRFFQSPLATGVTKVFVIGDWPRVVEGYSALGITVVVTQSAADLRAVAGRVGAPADTVPTTAYLRTAEPRDRQSAVEIPDGWRDLPWPEKRALAAKVTDVPVINSAQASEAIEAELVRRGTAIEPAETPAKIELGTDSGDQLSDDQLRAAIEAATGEKVHHKTGREKLVARFNELNAAAAARQEETASNGLTRREIEADLEGEGIEFDPREGVEDLLALRDKARAEREGNNG